MMTASSISSSRMQHRMPIKQQQQVRRRTQARTKIHHQSPVLRERSELERADSVSSLRMVMRTELGAERTALVTESDSRKTVKNSSFSMSESGEVRTWTVSEVWPGERTKSDRRTARVWTAAVCASLVAAGSGVTNPMMSLLEVPSGRVMLSEPEMGT